MKTLRSRLRRHLSYANVMASVAVFLALGGVGYAATTLNGNALISRSVGAGKLKNATLTSRQVKKDALSGEVINESTLAIVPQAQTAVSATTAASATMATTATTATSAASATHADSADEAGSAETAAKATTATSASTAADAETLEGLTPGDLQVACPEETELFGGMCWDEDVRAAHGWIAASAECGDAGGRLPSLSELIAYVLQPGEQVTGPTWTNDVVDVSGGVPSVVTRDEGTTATNSSPATNFGYRCLFYRVN